MLAPEFSFDLNTAPMLFIHGDADGYASMASVKAWEKLRRMGRQSDLHTLATRGHCFQMSASFVPVGPYKSYNFHIAVKSSLLQDLKYDKRSSRNNGVEWY